MSNLPEEEEFQTDAESESEVHDEESHEEKMKKLRNETEYKRIQGQFQKEMKEVIGKNTKEGFLLEAANYWCTYKECPCIARIDILMKTYHELVNSEFWLKVPITPFFTLENLYQHQQIHDDFIHIKMFHVD